MSQADRERWDEKYAALVASNRLAPNDWLCEMVADLPGGRALDLACGLGHNAVWLARSGWQVRAVDISSVGIQSARRLADSYDQQVDWIVADLDDFTPPADQFDLVTVFRFLDRHHVPALVERALKPDGLLLYETFTRSELKRSGTHLRSQSFTLAPGELPGLFPGLQVVSYEELELEDRSVARLVAMKPLKQGD